MSSERCDFCITHIAPRFVAFQILEERSRNTGRRCYLGHRLCSIFVVNCTSVLKTLTTRYFYHANYPKYGI